MINTEDYISAKNSAERAQKFRRHRQTDIQTDRDRQTDRQIDRQTDRQANRGTDGNRQAGRQSEVQFGGNDATMTDNHLWIQV